METGDEPVSTTTGAHLLAAIGSGAAAGAVTGTGTYYAVHLLIPTATSSVTTQVIAFEVDALLTASLAIAFNPVQQAPLALRFTSARDLALAFVAWLGMIGAPMAVRQNRLGHEEAQTTMGYTHSVTPDERRIADELGKILHATARNEQNERPTEHPLTDRIQ